MRRTVVHGEIPGRAAGTITVTLPKRPLLVRHPLQHAGLDQTVEPVGEHSIAAFAPSTKRYGATQFIRPGSV